MTARTPAHAFPSRRCFMRSSSAAVAIMTAGLFGSDPTASANQLTKEQRDTLTPDEIIRRMMAGNERFATGAQKPRDFLAEQRATAEGQYPAAVALTCVDSRTPLEVICDLGIGDTFNARIAGNVVNDDVLGSMEFACDVAGAKLVVVMGHTACGAVKGAIDNVRLGHLSGLIAKIQPAILETTYQGDRASTNHEFVDLVARTHVSMAVKQIQQHSPVLRKLETTGAIKIVGCMYDLRTARITLL
jgi:carbonic anhydrase